MRPPSSTPDPHVRRDVLISKIATFLTGQDRQALEDIRVAVGREIDDAGPDALAALGRRLTSPTAGWDYYPSDGLARRIHHVIADRLMPGGSGLHGAEHAAAVVGQPVVIFANHLSYSDANVLEILLQRGGAGELAGRLTAMAGPKVYLDRTRRFSSLCYGTIKTPQSSTRSSEDAVMSARDVARAARRVITLAHERIAAGGVLLVFAEGARSRTAAMQEMLAAAARYLDVPGTQILPVGLTGTEAMFPVGDDTLYLVPIVARIGAPIDVALLRERTGGDRRHLMDVIGLAIARLLPPAYRGVYGAVTAALEPANDVLESLV